MSLSTRRSLAMMAAEDGELQRADDQLTALIDGLAGDARVRAQTGQPADARQLNDVCQCLLSRAQVRQWAVRHAQALQDLAQVEALAAQLKPVQRGSVLIGLFDLRARLLAAPYSPVHNPDGALAAAAELRAVAEPSGMAWVADAVDLQLALSRFDWPMVARRAPVPIAELERLGQPRGAQALRVLQARAWLALGRPDQALAPAAAAHGFFAAEGPPDIAASAALALARARGRPQDWPLAEAALAQVEQLTRAQRSLFDQQRYLVEKLRLYDEAIALALGHASEPETRVSSPPAAQRQQAIERAWQVAERAKSFSLRQAMTQGGWLRAVDETCAAALQALDDRLDALDAQGPAVDEQVTSLRAALATERQQLLHAAMQRSPSLAATLAVPDWDLTAVLQALPVGVGVVSWYWLESPGGWQLNIFYAGADRLARLDHTHWGQVEIDEINQARQAHSTKRPFVVKQLLPAECGDRLLPPAVREALAGCHTLLLTPHRHLRQLPLHAMQVSDLEPVGTEGAASDAKPCHYLVEQFAVQVLPSLALPFPADPAGGPSDPALREVLLLGCEQDGFKSVELKDVPKEIDDLATCWAAGGHRVQAHKLPAHGQLPVSAALPQWHAFNVIHLACHGRFDAASPFDAALYLGRESLRAREFFDLQLRAEVVCLSACDVGQHSDRLDGLTLVSDEWLGLAMPLFQAGAQTLLTNLWRADSATAREFMETFHRALAGGNNPARAHQQACLAVLKKPFGLWAGWQLAGFPSKISTPPPTKVKP